MAHRARVQNRNARRGDGTDVVRGPLHNPEFRARTAFTVANSPLYQFNGCTMNVINPFKLKTHVLVFLDEFLILSSILEELLLHLAEVACQLRKVGLTRNVAKSQFGLKQVEYLGYIVGGGIPSA